MTPRHDGLTVRTAEYHIRDELAGQGFLVFRVTDPKTRFNLIAFGPDEPVRFIQVLTARPREAAGTYGEAVRRLSMLQRSGTIPGDLHLWTRFGDEWRNYVIMPGGAVRIDRGAYGSMQPSV